MAKDFLGKEIKVNNFISYVQGNARSGGRLECGIVTKVTENRIYISSESAWGGKTYKTDFSKIIVLPDSYKLKYKFGLRPTKDGKWK